MSLRDSPSNRKLRQLARRLQDTQGHLPNRVSPKKSLQSLLQDRLDKLESSVSHYLSQNEQTVSDMKQYIASLNEQLDEMRCFSESSDKDHINLVKEKEEEIAGLVKLTNLNATSISEQIEMDLRSKEAEVFDKISEEERLLATAKNAYERKAHRMLTGLCNELQNQKKMRARTIQELGARLQEKLDQAGALIQTEGKVRAQTYKKINQMQQDMSDRLRQDLSRIVRDRKDSNQKMLRLLQNACDSILY